MIYKYFLYYHINLRPKLTSLYQTFPFALVGFFEFNVFLENNKTEQILNLRTNLMFLLHHLNFFYLNLLWFYLNSKNFRLQQIYCLFRWHIHIDTYLIKKDKQSSNFTVVVPFFLSKGKQLTFKREVTHYFQIGDVFISNTFYFFRRLLFIDQGKKANQKR